MAAFTHWPVTVMRSYIHTLEPLVTKGHAYAEEMVICWHFGHLPLQSQRRPRHSTCDHLPDLVVYSPGQLHLLEDTVCWKANVASAKLRKGSKYLHLLELACSRGAQANLFTIQVGCRCFIYSKSLQHVFALTLTSTKVQRSLTSKTIRMLIEVSRTIWALCNQKLMSGRHAACFPFPVIMYHVSLFVPSY